LFIAGVFVHGLIIWTDPIQRIVACAAGCVAVLGAALMTRGGAFGQRVVVELREDQCPAGELTISVVAGGRPAPAELRLAGAHGEQTGRAARLASSGRLRHAEVRLATSGIRELRIWAHRVTPVGDFEGLG